MIKKANIKYRSFRWAKLLSCMPLLISTIGALEGGTLSVSWDPVADSRVAGYKIKYGTTTGNYTQSLSVGKVTSATLSGLTNGTTYYLVVAAVDSSQVEGVPSPEVTGVVLNASGVTASQTTQNSTVIIWQTNKPSDSQVDYGTTTSYGSSSPTISDQVTSHSVTLTGLTASTTYNYEVRSKDTGGSIIVLGNYTFATTAAADTTPPGDVRNLTAVAGDRNVTLSWTTPTDSDFKGVMIRFRTDGAFPVDKNDGTLLVNQLGTPNTSQNFSHTGLTNGTTYYYSAFSYDTAGNYSTTAHCQATPSSLTITSISPNKGAVGKNVVITGTGFGSSQGSSTVTFAGITAMVASWSDTSITATVPPNAVNGAVVVTVNGVQSNSVNFQVSNKLPPPGRIRVKG